MKEGKKALFLHAVTLYEFVYGNLDMYKDNQWQVVIAGQSYKRRLRKRHLDSTGHVWYQDFEEEKKMQTQEISFFL